MPKSPDELLAQVTAAFSGLPRLGKVIEEGVKAFQEGRISKWENPVLAFHDPDLFWTDLPDAILEEDHVKSLPFFLNAQEFQFYLPALMRYSLRHYDDRHKNRESMKTGATMICELPDRYGQFTAEQMQCTLDFLEAFTRYPDSFIAERAAKAFERANNYLKTRAKNT